MGDRIAVMKDGLLQQLDSPQVLHDHPANLFVAGFIGSPAMNFFPATLVQDNGTTYAEAAFFRAPLAASAARATGREVIVGVRPEDIDDMSARGSEGARDGHLPIEASVEVVEFLGNEFQLHLRAAGDSSFVARVSTDTRTTPGATIRLGFDTRKVHVFDRATEEALQ